jgi:hypothetical protein
VVILSRVGPCQGVSLSKLDYGLVFHVLTFHTCREVYFEKIVVVEIIRF